MQFFMTEIAVADWASTVRWFVDTLRLRVLLKDEPNQFALLEGESGGKLAIRQADQTMHPDNAIRLVFLVAALDREIERLRESGLTFDPPHTNEREAYRELRIIGPGGLRISIFEWTDANGKERSV